MRLPDDAGMIAARAVSRDGTIFAVARTFAVAATRRRCSRYRGRCRYCRSATTSTTHARIPRRARWISSRFFVTLAPALFRLHVTVTTLALVFVSRYRLDSLWWLSSLGNLLEVDPVRGTWRCWSSRRQRRRARRFTRHSSTAIRYYSTRELGKRICRVLPGTLELETVLAWQRYLHTIGPFLVVGCLQDKLVKERRIYRCGRSWSLSWNRPWINCRKYVENI